MTLTLRLCTHAAFACACAACTVLPQTSNSCDGPITYSFYPSETVSNCTMTRLTVAPTSDRQSQQLLFINTWIAANCSTVSDEEEEQVTQQRNNNKNSILSLLNAQS